MSDEQRAELDTITHNILTSYARHEISQRIGEVFLPSRQRIVEILGEVRQILFPGYFGHKELTQENIKFHVGNLLSRLEQSLGEQIYHCLCYAEGGEDTEPCREKAARIARGFLVQIPHIRALLALDVQAAYDGDPAAKSIDEIVYSYPGYHAVTVYRVAHELLSQSVPLMPRIMSEHAHSVTGADIHPGARIGKNFFIDHATGVVVGETTRIGDNVKIYQGVTLGALSFPKDERGRVIKGLQRHPTIEDDVTIYANATILGGETVIGRGATIGGNTFVTESVEPGATVVPNAPSLEVRSREKDG